MFQGEVLKRCSKIETDPAPRRNPGVNPRLLVLVVALAAACKEDKDLGTGAVAGTGPGDAQTPPTGRDAIEDWLAKGLYKSWHCEPAPHPARPPGAHKDNRICSNDLLSKHGAGEYPVGAASVKELIEGGQVSGFAVALKVKPGAEESWYWYERSSEEIEADGLGNSGRPKDVCVS